jgi:hypothetical protein
MAATNKTRTLQSNIEGSIAATCVATGHCLSKPRRENKFIPVIKTEMITKQATFTFFLLFRPLA